MKKLLVVVLLTLTSAAFASILYVDGVNGNDTNDCRTRQTACKTIGHAISLASAGDTIGVGPATYPENLNINVSLKLIGSGASTTIIDGGANNTVVTVSSTTANVVLSKLTIRNGKATQGGGIYNRGTLLVNNCTLSENSAVGTFQVMGFGGGIDNNDGTLTINNSTLSANSAYPWGGGIFNDHGFVTINNSTLSGNSAVGTSQVTGFGGGIDNNNGVLTINNSTLSANSATNSSGDASGGGIFNGNGFVTINNSTLSGNTASTLGGGINTIGHAVTINNSTVSGGSAGNGGGGIAKVTEYTMLTITNSIVADNSGGNCSGGAITSNGYNLSSDNTCNFSGPGDLNNTKPLLGPLQNNGGPTQTQALLPGSPAIDAGNPNGCTDGSGHLLKTDQRGAPRPDKEDTGGCDMGAFERQRD
jgi:hypothetical protein